MASALCPHGWPWFEECPFCFQEMWVEPAQAELLEAYADLVARGRSLLTGTFLSPPVFTGDLVSPLAPDVKWFLLNTTPRLPLQLRRAEEAVVFGVSPDGGSLVAAVAHDAVREELLRADRRRLGLTDPDPDSYQPASGAAHPSVGKE